MSESERPKELSELIKRLERVIGYVPVGTYDLLRVLAHPDVVEYSLDYFTTSQKG